ncbi:hypothetical protein [Mycoplasma parvum]|uniref:Uncharacterized protein n=1 Tax=Mycoplasma parvum str. Indiana TaxID=1403316 RepID=U5NB97_9MOLU|nr:hypothetical protein [Mycoplasma parvum]AGX88826.1 hypothetical protein PRV_00205 [Mycoplasma parvum str. Indiana]
MIGRERWNQERKEQKVQLESIYRYSEAGYSEANKSGCILYRDGDRISEETDIVEGTEKEDMRDPCDWRTNWSLEKYKEGKKGGF